MRTKIIASIGPSSDSYETIKALAEAGMDIARINFSHATHEEYRERKSHIERVYRELGREINILADLQGPRMRVGLLPEEGRKLSRSEEIMFSTDPDDAGAICIDNPFLHHEILPGEPLFLANGDIECEVTEIAGRTIKARVIRGGMLFSRKGVNTPRTKLSIAGLTEKDMEDARFVLEEGVDYIAVSFVQDASDLDPIKLLAGESAKIIAKIETALALDNIDAIIRASDGIMIARGDLGIEIPREKVPFVQKHLIKHAAWLGKPSITATQILLTMVNHSVPTRAEVSDVVNAILDGTDALMLSDETASGRYPVEAVSMMRSISEEAEREMLRSKSYF